MPCKNCERAIAGLRAELEALRDASKQWQEATLDRLDEVMDRLRKHQNVLVDIEQRMHNVFTRIEEAATRSTLAMPEKEDPPRRH